MVHNNDGPGFKSQWTLPESAPCKVKEVYKTSPCKSVQSHMDDLCSPRHSSLLEDLNLCCSAWSSQQQCIYFWYWMCVCRHKRHVHKNMSSSLRGGHFFHSQQEGWPRLLILLVCHGPPYETAIHLKCSGNMYRYLHEHPPTYVSLALEYNRCSLRKACMPFPPRWEGRESPAIRSPHATDAGCVHMHETRHTLSVPKLGQQSAYCPFMKFSGELGCPRALCLPGHPPGCAR